MSSLQIKASSSSACALEVRSGLDRTCKRALLHGVDLPLRAGAGFEICHRVYRNLTLPEKVAAFLILHPDMPRSLAACMNETVVKLHRVASQQSAETLRRAGRLQSDLQNGRIDEILAIGLHAYVPQFLDRVSDLGLEISHDFLVPMAA